MGAAVVPERCHLGACRDGRPSDRTAGRCLRAAEATRFPLDVWAVPWSAQVISGLGGPDPGDERLDVAGHLFCTGRRFRRRNCAGCAPGCRTALRSEGFRRDLLAMGDLTGQPLAQVRSVEEHRIERRVHMRQQYRAYLGQQTPPVMVQTDPREQSGLVVAQPRDPSSTTCAAHRVQPLPKPLSS